MTKAFQPRSDRIDSISDLLDSMHVEVKELGGVFTHKVWSKAVLVPPTQHVTGDEVDDTIDGKIYQRQHFFCRSFVMQLLETP